MSGTSKNQNTPKSIRQKRILSVAAENPDASLEQIAAEVATATADLVETVLDEYGDPAEQAIASGQSGGKTATSDGGSPGPESGSWSIDEPSSEEPSDSKPSQTDSQSEIDAASESKSIDSIPSPEELTPKQRETLAAIRAHPEATQRELAEILGVSAPTVSNRVNVIPEFEWEQRLQFVETLLKSSDSDILEAFESTSSVSEESGSDERTAQTGNDSTTATPSTDAETDDRDEKHSDGADHLDGPTESDLDTSERPVAMPAEQIENLIQSIDRFHSLLDADGGPTHPNDDEPTESPFDDPELVHKIVHACMESEQITEDEELDIINQLV